MNERMNEGQRTNLSTQPQVVYGRATTIVAAYSLPSDPITE